MNNREAEGFPEPLVDRLQRMLDKLDEDGISKLRDAWREEYESARRRHIGDHVTEIVDSMGENYDVIAESLGFKSRSSVWQAKKGNISLEKYQMLVDLYGPGQGCRPTSERIAPATMRAMSCARGLLGEKTEYELTRELYEYLRRVARSADWWRARLDRDVAALEEIALQLRVAARQVVEEVVLTQIRPLVKAIDEWVFAYLICLSSLDFLEGAK